MGCEIHGTIEVYYMTGLGWDTVCTVHIPRDYNLFSRLAGVRGWLDPIVEPRGLPDGVGFWTRMAYGDGVDLHTASWLLFKEMETLEQEDVDYPLDFWHMMKGLAKVHGKRYVRLVFWFDS